MPKIPDIKVISSAELLRRIDAGEPLPPPGSLVAEDPVGFNGRLNIYTCDKCRGHSVTRDLDDGVTPFMISCGRIPGHRLAPGCRGYMKSSMYKVFDQTMQEDGHWYKPDTSSFEYKRNHDHCSRGGLLLKPVELPSEPS